MWSIPELSSTLQYKMQYHIYNRHSVNLALLYWSTKRSILAINIIKIWILRYNYLQLVSQEYEKKNVQTTNKIMNKFISILFKSPKQHPWKEHLLRTKKCRFRSLICNKLSLGMVGDQEHRAVWNISFIKFYKPYFTLEGTARFQREKALSCTQQSACWYI